MSELCFLFEEMHREVNEFYDLAKPFLDPTAEACLGKFAADLKTIRSKSPLANNPENVLNHPYPWVIPGHQPLLTKPSQWYEKGKKQRGPEIVGRLTAVWEITPDPKKWSLDVPKQFRLTGKASVVVEWVDVATHATLTKWNVDVADTAAPGCMFHIQFPSVVSVPRLPCIAFTPLAVAEFVLGELFQNKWEAHSQGASFEQWSAIQKRRLLRLLAWQKQVVDNCAGSPWTALKTKPFPHDQFVNAQ